MKQPVSVNSSSKDPENSFMDMVKLAASEGIKELALSTASYVSALKEGYKDEDVLNIIDECGVAVKEVEPVTGWGTEVYSNQLQREKEEMIFHMAHIFGLNHVHCRLMEKIPLDQIAASFGQLCDRAGELNVLLEFLPESGVPNPESAAKIVRDCGRKNSGTVRPTVTKYF